MLRCPKCNRTYQDDMQKFCTHDGGRLAPDIEKPKTFDPNATVTGDASALDIPVEPSDGLPTVYDLGATVAAPPPSAPLSNTPYSAPSTSGLGSSNTAPTAFPDTTRLGQQQPKAPQQPPASYTPSPPPPPHNAHVSAQAPPIVQPSAPIVQPSVSTPLPQPAEPAPSPSAPLPAAPKKSKVGMSMVVIAVLVLVILVGGSVGAYFLFIKEKTPKRGRDVVEPPVIKAKEDTVKPDQPADVSTKPGVPPNSVKFQNSSASLDGKLSEHYVDFYFYYPQLWQKNPTAGVAGAANFVEVERKLPPDFTQENVTVSWYESKGTVEADLAGKLPSEIKARNGKLASRYPEYQKVSEGKTTVNGIEGYEFRFKAVSRGTDKGDIFIWGRVVYLPPGDETSTKGVILNMFTTSLAPELKSVDDVGVKGELPVILNSFTLGKS